MHSESNLAGQTLKNLLYLDAVAPLEFDKSVTGGLLDLIVLKAGVFLRWSIPRRVVSPM